MKSLGRNMNDGTVYIRGNEFRRVFKIYTCTRSPCINTCVCIYIHHIMIVVLYKLKLYFLKISRYIAPVQRLSDMFIENSVREQHNRVIERGSFNLNFHWGI